MTIESEREISLHELGSENTKARKTISEARERAAEETQKALRKYSLHFQDQLPKQVIVGVEESTGETSILRQRWEVISYNTREGTMTRFRYMEKPEFNYDGRTGIETVKNNDSYLTSYPTNSDHWLKFGHRTLDRMGAIVSRRAEINQRLNET